MKTTTIIKKTRTVGTSSGVLLPKSWLGRNVVVTLHFPSQEEILNEVLTLARDKLFLEEIKGIYIIGSYARGDFNAESDIDILVITSSKNGIIKKDNYEINIISESILLKNLKTNLYIQTAIKESVSLLNSDLIKKIKGLKIKLKTIKITSEIKRIIRINKEAILMYEKKVPDGIIYSIVLRLRELFFLNCLIKKSNYNHKKFISLIGQEKYNAYLRIKNDKKERNDVTLSEAKELIDLSEQCLKNLEQKKQKLV